MNSAPDVGIGDISERCPFDVPNESPTRAGKDNNLVRSVLSNPVKGIDKFGARLRVHDERAAVTMKRGNQHAFVITGELHMAIRGKVVSLKRLHHVLLS